MTAGAASGLALAILLLLVIILLTIVNNRVAAERVHYG